MDHTYWQKQTSDKPLFPDLLWSRPENKNTAGKLLIIGGNATSMVAPAQAFAAAIKASVGSQRVLLPDTLSKKAQGFDYIEFAPSTPSGGFSKTALAVWLELSQWADGVLLAGDFGHNSETAIVLEKFLTKFRGQIVITGDALDLLQATPQQVYTRKNTLVVPSFKQLQKAAALLKFPTAFTSKMDYLHFVEALHDFSQEFASLIIKHQEQAIVAAKGKVSTTSQKDLRDIELASRAAVWWVQNPNSMFSAVSSAVL